MSRNFWDKEQINRTNSQHVHKSHPAHCHSPSPTAKSLPPEYLSNQSDPLSTTKPNLYIPSHLLSFPPNYLYSNSPLGNHGSSSLPVFDSLTNSTCTSITLISGTRHLSGFRTYFHKLVKLRNGNYLWWENPSRHDPHAALLIHISKLFIAYFPNYASDGRVQILGGGDICRRLYDAPLHPAPPSRIGECGRVGR